MFTTKKYQALHDLWVDSIVVVKDPSKENAAFLKVERESDDKVIMPSKKRRTLVIIGYNIIIFILLSFVHTQFVSAECAAWNDCSRADKTAEAWIGFSWLLLISLSVVFGWKGILPGSRRKLIESWKEQS